MSDDFQRYHEMARAFIDDIPPYPAEAYSGRGVVISGGGIDYFPCAWVCIRMLRRLGCRLPIELWHLGPFEMSDEMRELVKPLGVTCVDAHEIRRAQPVRRLGGWESKPFSILHSRFEEVLYLDADNVPVVDPSFLFTSEPYAETGAVFWPDYAPVFKSSGAWRLCEVPYRSEPSFESGQMLVHKERCWAPLQLTMHYNEHSEVYHPHTGGDKDTFHMAWRRLEQEHTMIPYAVRDLSGRVMRQHDFSGRVIFQHRNLAKWKLDPDANPRIEGFECEDMCFEELRALNEKWCGHVRVPLPDNEPARRLAEEVIQTRWFLYHRLGFDRRFLELLEDQSIGEGGAGLEKSWHVEMNGEGSPLLCIRGNSDVTCALARESEGRFTGRWRSHERMPIQLVARTKLPRKEIETIEKDRLRDRLRGRQLLFVRVRRDCTLARFEDDRLVMDGAPGSRGWTIRYQDDGTAELILTREDGRRSVLREDPDGIWRGTGDGPVELIPVPD